MKRRIFILLLAAALLCLNPLTACAVQAGEAAETPPAPTAAGFTDVPAGADYAPAVAWCRERGLLKGTSGTTFSPDQPLTRAMLATALYRAAGSPAVEGEMPFTDGEAGSWYADAVIWADAQGYMKGYGGRLFGVADPVSKEMLEVTLGRYTGEGPGWVGDPAKTASATRAEIAVALMAALNQEEGSGAPAQGGKVLVAYFSATGTTAGVAEKLARATGGTLFEIRPESAYTAADLNYNTSCRANTEQNDETARPAIAADCVVEDWEEYDVVLLGYPIWWGIPPKIMRTFAEGYDWSGKTVAGFCTSGSSGYSNAGLPALTAGAQWLEGRRFAGSAAQSTIESWVDSLNLPQ